MQNLKFVSQKLRNAMSFKTNTENSEKGITMKTTQNKFTTALLTTSTLMVLGTTALLAESPKVFYFNGMNTSEPEARDERDEIKRAVQEKYTYKARNFDPVLIYTYSRGLTKDTIGVAFDKYENILRDYEKGLQSQKRQICTVNPRGCKREEIEYQNAKDQMATSLTSTGVICSDRIMYPYGYYQANMAANVQIISYSRGNIIANVVQDSMCNGAIAKRTNIASAAEHRYGDLFTLKSDLIIGALDLYRKTVGKSSRYRNLYPDYYGMVGNWWKNAFRNGAVYSNGVYYKAYAYKFYLNKYFFGKERYFSHNLEQCYLNRRFGIFNNITKDIFKNYEDLGGR